MDLLASSRVYDTILTVDRAATTALTDFVTDSAYRDPDSKSFLINGFGGTGGKLTLRIKYRLLQHSEIERTVIATFVTDIGQVISTRSTVIVEKIS